MAVVLTSECVIVEGQDALDCVNKAALAMGNNRHFSAVMPAFISYTKVNQKHYILSFIYQNDSSETVKHMKGYMSKTFDGINTFLSTTLDIASPMIYYDKETGYYHVIIITL
jgi:hypothetical protein